MTTDTPSHSREAHAAYDQHVKPVEQAHTGEYVLVTPEGRMIFAPSLVEVMQRAHERSNPGNHIFKVGDVALGKIR